MLLAPLLFVAACKEPAGPEQQLSGKQIYDRNCARCHGLDGKPTKVAPTARDLRNRSYMDSLGDDKIKRTIMSGRPPAGPNMPPAMPAFGGQFSDPELKVLVGYVRSLSNPELGPDRLAPEAVRESAGSQPTGE
jgi:mono/diheme cytochrome c family protein